MLSRQRWKNGKSTQSFKSAKAVYEILPYLQFEHLNWGQILSGSGLQVLGYGSVRFQDESCPSTQKGYQAKVGRSGSAPSRAWAHSGQLQLDGLCILERLENMYWAVILDITA